MHTPNGDYKFGEWCEGKRKRWLDTGEREIIEAFKKDHHYEVHKSLTTDKSDDSPLKPSESIWSFPVPSEK
jgi:hypothetical protein